MGYTFTEEVFNAREEDVSGDLMRAQALISRDLQNLLGDGSADATGTPISCTTGKISATGLPGTFNATLIAGAGFYSDPADSGLTGDDSFYKFFKWLGQNVTFANPNGANPRIDLIVAAPAMVSQDLQSRLVMTDPVSRTYAPQNLFKTLTPQATISVVTGVAASNPTLPAIPARSVAIMAVWVPAASADAVAFGYVPMLWRRAPWPFSGSSGVVTGMGLKWDLAADPATTSSKISTSGFHRLVIDGEVLEWTGTIDSAGAGVVVDTSNNPFTVAAPASWAKPYYIYAVGGRHNPMLSRNADATVSPVTLVESLTPPDIKRGRPTVSITCNGTVVAPVGAVYVGLGFVVPNDTKRAGCIMDDTYTYFGPGAVAGANSIVVTKTGGGLEFLSSPPAAALVQFPVSAEVLMVATLVGATTSFFELYPDHGGGGASPQFTSSYGLMPLKVLVGGAGQFNWARGKIPWPDVGAGALWVKGGVAGDAVQVVANAYTHRVRLFGACAAP